MYESTKESASNAAVNDVNRFHAFFSGKKNDCKNEQYAEQTPCHDCYDLSVRVGEFLIEKGKQVKK